MPQFIYTMKDLRKVTAQGKEILRGIWLSFYEGAKIGVLGPNGAGKSTLLRVMAGQDRDFAGEAFLGEGYTVGMLSQEPALQAGKTVREVVEEGVAGTRALLTKFEEIASGAAYEGSAVLGNTHRGDGRRFKGRGPIQVTGRYNYTAASKYLGVDLVSHPRLAARPKIGFRVAAWFWVSRTPNLNVLADRGDFRGITYRINGGYNGLSARYGFYARAQEVLGSQGLPGL